MIADARQQSGAEKLKGHDIMGLERFDPEVKHMVLSIMSIGIVTCNSKFENGSYYQIKVSMTYMTVRRSKALFIQERRCGRLKRKSVPTLHYARSNQRADSGSKGGGSGRKAEGVEQQHTDIRFSLAPGT